MGNWAIVIQGTGCHHNDNPQVDADIAAAEFVAKLKAQGHQVEFASFTSGGKTDLLSKSMAYQPLSITVNGKKFTLDGAVEISYERVRELAGFPAGTTPTMTWHCQGRMGGTLWAGHSVSAYDDMIFNVADTSNA